MPTDDTNPILSAGAPRPRKRWPWLLILVALGAGAGLAISRSQSADTKGGGKAGKGGKGTAPRAIPVVGAAAHVGDLGVYQAGLGTVTALSTVTVRSRVDGQLVNVAYQEGQLVRKGDLLAQIDPRPFEVQLMQAQGQLAKDEATLKNELLDLERFRKLAAEGVIPAQQVDTQQAAINSIEGTLKSDAAQIESAKLNLAYTKITAPVTGRVGLRLVDPGNIVHANDQNGLVVIAQQQPIAVVFTLPSDQLETLARASHDGHVLIVEAFDRDLKRKLATGKLAAIDNQIDVATGTVKLKAVFDNEDGALFPNLFVNARLLVDTLKGAVIVPTAALQRSPQATYVWVAKQDSTVEMRDVDVQLTAGDDTAIKKGVAAGEVLVIDGADKLQPDAKVAVTMAGEARTKGPAPAGKAPASTAAGTKGAARPHKTGS